MALQSPRTAPVDYMREANESTLTFATIETATALANVDAIAAPPASMPSSSARTILQPR
jgi:2-keto-3-deoxy-L-rhamnonate aldolase RhmA